MIEPELLVNFSERNLSQTVGRALQRGRRVEKDSEQLLSLKRRHYFPLPFLFPASQQPDHIFPVSLISPSGNIFRVYSQLSLLLSLVIAERRLFPLPALRKASHYFVRYSVVVRGGCQSRSPSFNFRGRVEL